MGSIPYSGGLFPNPRRKMIECTRFNALEGSGCLGFAEVRVTGWGLTINSISLHRKNERFWVNMPQRTYEKDGEKKYMPYLRMEDSEKNKEFMRQVLEAVLKKRSEMDTVVPADEKDHNFNRDFPF